MPRTGPIDAWPWPTPRGASAGRVGAAPRRGRPVAATAGTRFCRFCREQATWRTPCSPCVYRAGPYRRRSVPRTPRSARGPRGGARRRVEASSRRPPSRPTWVCAQKLGFGSLGAQNGPGEVVRGGSALLNRYCDRPEQLVGARGSQTYSQGFATSGSSSRISEVWALCPSAPLVIGLQRAYAPPV